MATCHSTSKSFLILQTCQPAFLRFTELWGTSCTHLQTSKMAKLDLVAFNFLAWRMLLWALRDSRGVKPARRGGGRCWYRKPKERRTGGWEVSARSWLAHAPVRWQSCPDEQEAARTDFCWLLQTNTRRAWPTFDRTQQEILVHPAWDTWLKVPTYCLLKMIWKRMQHLKTLFFAVSHSSI